MWVVQWGLLLRRPWRTWVCPCEDQVWRWCSSLGHRGSGNTPYSGELAARTAGSTSSRRVQQPVLANMLQNSCLEQSGRPQSTGLQRVGHNRSDPVWVARLFFACGSSAPVRVEREGGKAGCLAGTLVAPSVQRHGLPPPQELWPYQSLFFFFFFSLL